MSAHPGLRLTDVHAAILPTVKFVPTIHLTYSETVLPMKDGLAKLKDFPPPWAAPARPFPSRSVPAADVA